ncbi:MAG: indolepyruvate oxidoreductase subunit beta [Succinivibrio sp.]|uniref:Indolepyruvate oxidoreductase subunit beta n=1 Tax=Succinivibrio faecicola TaxID=2820300 RepID=A0ABS7DH38_9GAMM|nr:MULTISPECIES: indolepyruvate oxidoreductase subunit beta [Succinivibrio]MBW7570437.1 indolepyruvate oxidoreductase subunit beta [Succinivibrio faecicola]MCI6939723.1 indolepyruvate oxidoreductase subunit beta [Succinatimonas hippei]MDD6205225.1 indolepyruvate oxidoreductase subunit beta [Succinivibrio sp.]
MDKNILICGVGGQGTVLASKLTASAAMLEGNTVHSAETIGMAQRGGSVTSHIRIGDKAFSPLIPDGLADLIMAFEPAEAVRNLKYLKKGGTVIVNKKAVKPVTESLLDTGYDGSKMIAFLKDNNIKTYVLDADELCSSLGSVKFFNIALLGVAVATGDLGLKKESLENEIKTKVKEKFVQINLKAFETGYKLGQELCF